MKLFIDTANLDEIREIAAWGVLAGCTTNPSLVAREGGDFIQRVVEICDLLQGPVSAEVIAQDVDGMVRQGRLLAGLSDHVVVKLPLTEAGIAATSRLADEGIPCNVTLCFQAAQALLAAKAGAAYISPFIGRVDDITWEGAELIRQIADIYAMDTSIETEVLAASIRTPLHLVQVALAGAHVATAPYKVLKAALTHPLTTSGNTQFLTDWEKVPAADRDIEKAVEAWRKKNDSGSKGKGKGKKRD